MWRHSPSRRTSGPLRSQPAAWWLVTDRGVCDSDHDPLINSTAMLVLDVISSPVQAKIAGPNGGVPSERDIVLDGTSSDDPDGDEHVAWHYIWSCLKLEADGSKSACRNYMGQVLPPLPSSPTITIVNGTFAPLQTIEITLLAGKHSRNSTATSVLTLLPGDPPTLNIPPRASNKVAPSAKLAVVASVASRSKSTLQLAWTQDEGDLDMTLKRNFLVWPLSRESLVIAPDVLTPGASYKFRLTGRDVNGESFVVVDVVANRPPVNGWVEVSPASGFVMVTKFAISALGWTDDVDDYPFKYSFGTVDAAGLETPLGDQTASNKLETMLSLGNEKLNYTVNVFMYVADRFNTRARAATSCVCEIEPVEDMNAFLANATDQILSNIAGASAEETLQAVGALLSVMSASATKEVVAPPIDTSSSSGSSSVVVDYDLLYCNDHGTYETVGGCTPGESRCSGKCSCDSSWHDIDCSMDQNTYDKTSSIVTTLLSSVANLSLQSPAKASTTLLEGSCKSLLIKVLFVEWSFYRASGQGCCFESYQDLYYCWALRGNF